MEWRKYEASKIYTLLQSHLEKYPEMTCQDMVKLLYQNEFGGGHLIADEAQSLLRLQEEYGLSRQDKSPAPAAAADAAFPPLSPLPVEDIGNGLCRCHLSKLSSESLKPLNTLFCASSKLVHGSPAAFLKKLEALSSYAAEHFTPAKRGECLRYLSAYRQAGCPQPRHSSAYREAYSPAYRVLLSDLASLIPVFSRIDALLQAKPFAVIGIDGKCGAGKSTLAHFLEQFYDAYVIHMDDFFLPPKLRTPERLSEPGGNIHYERFLDEVIKPLIAGDSRIAYRRFSCRIMDYEGECAFTPSSRRLLIAEGSYSMRPEFLAAYDLTLFLEIADGPQLERIRRRNGPDMLPAFRNKWIPMENRYFSHYDIPAIASCRLTLSSL